MAADYIVIGSGSAGAVVASRISERPSLTVILLEAGGHDITPNIHIPSLYGMLFQSQYDWNYRSEPQRHCHHRREYVPRGKVLGGSSSINALVYQRGNPSDYDHWASLGNHGWSWNEVLPYFKKSQHQERGESTHHGVGGPLHVSSQSDPHPLSLTFVRAAQQAGYPANDDFNAGHQEGFGLMQLTLKEGMRCSTARGFLDTPAKTRSNLSIVTNAHVVRLAMDGDRCVGAVYVRDGREVLVEARREVIVCAGAINSPQLLMLSGIGPRGSLERLGINVIVDLPGVGRNLQEHLMVPVCYYDRDPITFSETESKNEIHKYVTTRSGRLSHGPGQACGFVKLADSTTSATSAAPEIQIQFAPLFYVDHSFKNPVGLGFTLLPGLVTPRSVGSVELRSADPLDAPRIDFNFLDDEADMRVLVEGVKVARRIANAPAFDKNRGKEYLPGAEVKEDEQIREFVRDFVQSIYHPVGTCKMGRDALAVVNERLQVHGVRGLRVADASIMPTIVNANTNAACIMIGEKCADFILNGLAKL